MPWRRMGKWGAQIQSLLTYTLNWGEWSFSKPGRFIPGERFPCTHEAGESAGPNSRSGLFGEEKNIRHSQQLNHDPSAVQPVVSSLYLLRYLHSYLDPIIAKLVFCSKCTWNEVLRESISNYRITHLEHFMYIQYHVRFISSRRAVSLHFM
jgi:hypothetical protein